jgi:MFS family permease
MTSDATKVAADDIPRRIPIGVWVLGAVSLLMDVSSEIANSLLPIYMTQHLMVSAAAVGLVEGLAMATASATKLFAGVLSDRVQSRKALTVLGYGLAALSKPLFPLADTLMGIVGAKFVDRVGKGIRSAPRDALVADMAPPEVRGASFGVRKGLDTVGGFIGPIAAVALMASTGNDARRVLWFATIPAALAVAVLFFGVQEPPRTSVIKSKTFRWTDALSLTTATWVAIGITSLLTLARFSEAFLVLRAAESGLTATTVPLVLVGLHLAFGLASYPAGAWSDRIGRRPVLVTGVIVLLAAHLVLATGRTPAYLWTGVALWGLHMGLTQGVLASLLSDAAPAHMRGSAFGVASVLTGLVMLVGNTMAGLLWHWHGAEAVFYVSATMAAAVAAALLWWRPQPDAQRDATNP